MQPRDLWLRVALGQKPASRRTFATHPWSKHGEDGKRRAQEPTLALLKDDVNMSPTLGLKRLYTLPKGWDLF